jgi:glycosyltransferase involved in cell wall biosynthesis
VARSILNLASGFADRGHRVDLVLCQAVGPYLNQVPAKVNLVELKASPGWRGRARVLSADSKALGSLLLPVLLPYKAPQTVRYLPDLVRYLQREQPVAILSAKTPANLTALWARRLARTPTRVVISERSHLSRVMQSRRKWQWRFVVPVIRRVYPWADAIVSVSNGVADDLSLRTGIPRERITTIYNPVVTLELFSKAAVPLDHPWFQAGAPPVVLGAGRLTAQKDFPTLLRAFARVHAVRPTRLVILGEGNKRADLETLATKLGIAKDLALPGFVDNPYAYMACAAVFVLSSAWEGFGNVLAEALACGCPVVSTDCPSGPAEILDSGVYGPLMPVGDDGALAQAILSVLATPPNPDRLRVRAALFSVDRAADRYLELLFDNR